MKAATFLGFVLLASAAPAQAIARQGSPSSADEVAEVAARNPEIQQIATDCSKSNADCLKHFDRYERSMKEHSASGGFSLFGLFKGSSLTFWGAGQELNYTEVTYVSDPKLS